MVGSWHLGGHSPQPRDRGASRASAAGRRAGCERRLGARARGPTQSGAEPGRAPDAAAGRRLLWGRGGLGSGGVAGRAVGGPAATATVTKSGGEAGGRGAEGRRGSRLLRACAAGAGRRRPQPQQRATARPRRPTVLRGPSGRAGTPDGSGEGRVTSCGAPAPGRSPRAAGPRAPSPRRLRGQRPPPYSPARWGSALPAALRSSAGSKPLGLQVFRFSQALAPPLPGRAWASISGRSPALPSGGSPGWLAALFISKLRPSPWHSAPSAEPRPFPGSPSPTLAPLHSVAHPAPKPQRVGGLVATRPASKSTPCIFQPIKEANSASSAEAANALRLRAHPHLPS